MTEDAVTAEDIQATQIAEAKHFVAIGLERLATLTGEARDALAADLHELIDAAHKAPPAEPEPLEAA